MRRRDLLGGLSLVPLAAPAVAQCVVATFPRINLADRCEGGGDLPSLDLTFMVPGSLDPRITFTRASTGTYFDSAGVLRSAATNAPRWDHDPATLQLRGMLLEEARTNLLLNSATLSTQSVTVTAVAHTLSFYGTGTITKSGVATGALVGTGATQRVSQTFTPTAGSLTLTVTGTVSNAQIEAGSFATSYIPTTSAAVTRAVDSCTVPTANMAWMTGTPGGTWYGEFIATSTQTLPRIIGRIGAGGTAAPMYVNASRQIIQFDTTSSMNTVNALTLGAISKAVTTYLSGNSKACLNGGAVATSTALTNGYNGLFANGMYLMASAGPPASEIMTGHLRAVRYWATILSDVQMQALTS